jgi:hypothetical protein
VPPIHYFVIIFLRTGGCCRPRRSCCHCRLRFSKRRRILLLKPKTPPIFQGTMPLGKRKIIQPIPITLRHVQSRGIALHTPEDRLGRHVVLMPTIPQFFPNFAPPALLRCGGIDAAPHPHGLPEKGGNQRSAG